MSFKLINLAIKVNNKLHNQLYDPFMFWEPEKMTLQKLRNKVKLILWYLDQLIGVFLYGFLACTYCAMREVLFRKPNMKVNLLNITLFIAASVTAYTIFVTTRAMIYQSDQVMAGMNALRKYQSKLSHRYPMQAFEVAMENENLLKKKRNLLGLWLVSSIVLSAATMTFTFPAVYFNLDPLYFILLDITAYFPIKGLSLFSFYFQIYIRVALCLTFLFCLSRFYSFLYIFGLLQMQGYMMSLSFLKKLHLASNLFSELRQMRIIHSCLYPFCNALYAMIMLYGQLTVLIIWTAVRGWNHLPRLVVGFLPLFALIIGGWTFSILTIIGNVHKASIEVVKKGRHNIPPKFRGKLLGYQLLKRESLVQFPMSFRCGSLFVISKESGLYFLLKLLENIANSIIIFRV